MDRYFETLFEEAFDSGKVISVVTLPGANATEKRGAKPTFCRTVEEAVRAAQTAPAGHDVYVGLCPLWRVPPQGDEASASETGRKRKPVSRGTEDDVGAVVCLWADVDVSGAAHKSKGKVYPPNRDEARKVLHRLGIPPSFTVDSGYGLHGYWLLSEPWILDTPDERKHAAEFVYRWGATVKAAAGALGYDVDSIYDLPRILRVPETQNFKGAQPVPVVANWPDGMPLRYHLPDLEPLLVAPEQASRDRSSQSIPEVGLLNLAPNSTPPFDKFNRLVQLNPKFAQTFDGRNSSLADQSPSGFDLSLANVMAEAGWSDQEIVGTLIAFRRKHNHPPKLRQDYYQRTIGMARSKLNQTRAASAVLAETADIPSDGESLTPNELDDIRKQLGTLLGIRIARWIKVGLEGAIYQLELENERRVVIGGVANVTRHANFRDKVYEATGAMIPDMKASEWSKVCQRLGMIEVHETHDEQDAAEEMRGMLAAYFTGRVRHDEDQWHEAVGNGQPFKRGGRLYLYLNSFTRYLRTETGGSVRSDDVRGQFRRLGMVSAKEEASVEGKPVWKVYWSVPETVLL